MYVPPLFQVDDPETLYAIMEQHSFATLVTQTEGGLSATHLPLLLDRACPPNGRVLAHMARANPQWRAFDGTTECLIIFQGEHGYISPAWYDTHPSVPTWNYAAVHAYGVPRVIEDTAQIRDTLEQLVIKHEAGAEDPWRMDLPEEYLSGMINGIVAFEIPISRLEGKLKMSQNRPVADRKRVIQTLAESNEPTQQRLAASMAEVLLSRASEHEGARQTP